MPASRRARSLTQAISGLRPQPALLGPASVLFGPTSPSPSAERVWSAHPLAFGARPLELIARQQEGPAGRTGTASSLPALEGRPPADSRHPPGSGGRRHRPWIGVFEVSEASFNATLAPMLSGGGVLKIPSGSHNQKRSVTLHYSRMERTIISACAALANGAAPLSDCC